MKKKKRGGLVEGSQKYQPWEAWGSKDLKEMKKLAMNHVGGKIFKEEEFAHLKTLMWKGTWCFRNSQETSVAEAG